MKKITVMFLVMMPALLLAQSPMDKLYDKYAGQERVTSVNISSEMFEMLASMKIDTTKLEDHETKNMVDAISKMNGMKILTYSKNGANDNTFYNEIKASFDLDEYYELMTVRDEDSDVKFYAKKEGDKISELLMIADEDKETVLMNFSGLFDMRTIAKIGQSMEMHGMDKLEKLEEKK